MHKPTKASKTTTLVSAPMASANVVATEARTPGRNTCVGQYPDFFQDPEFVDSGMWLGQVSMNVPSTERARVFRLSQAFPETLQDEDPARWGWLEFNPFDTSLGHDDRSKQGRYYLDAVMKYLQAGNVERGARGGNEEEDWSLCQNDVRAWFHMPWQTYDPLTGREYLHGLTREAKVSFQLRTGQQVMGATWGLGFYNARGAYQLGRIWKADGSVTDPLPPVSFPEGTVVGHMSFTTLTPEDLPQLEHMPVWTINSSTGFCTCTPASGPSCSLQEMATQCLRSPRKAYLLQFDVAVKDARSSTTGWVFGTFVADGIHKSGKANPWDRLSPLGLMWGNDPPSADKTAKQHPEGSAGKGFSEQIVFEDALQHLNQHADAGHLGCNGRLNGPADSAISSCLSCHQTASVPDLDLTTPTTFKVAAGGKGPGQCQTEPGSPETDAVYFGNLASGAPLAGPAAIVPAPRYEQAGKSWLSLDYSLQLSVALAQYGTWQRHLADLAQLADTEPADNAGAASTDRVSINRHFDHPLPNR